MYTHTRARTHTYIYIMYSQWLEETNLAAEWIAQTAHKKIQQSSKQLHGLPVALEKVHLFSFQRKLVYWNDRAFNVCKRETP